MGWHVIRHRQTFGLAILPLLLNRSDADGLRGAVCQTAAANPIGDMPSVLCRVVRNAVWIVVAVQCPKPYSMSHGRDAGSLLAALRAGGHIRVHLFEVGLEDPVP